MRYDHRLRKSRILGNKESPGSLPVKENPVFEDKLLRKDGVTVRPGGTLHKRRGTVCWMQERYASLAPAPLECKGGWVQE